MTNTPIDRESMYRELRENLIHSLRSQGWPRMDAEDEADRKIEAMRQRARAALLGATPLNEQSEEENYDV